jgi:hypothetical protein
MGLPLATIRNIWRECSEGEEAGKFRATIARAHSYSWAACYIIAYLYPPGTWCPSYTPKHSVPFSSPPTTHMATMKVFEPAFTRG